ncbi:MAG: YihY family inner membrane protein, partial [Elusimicrobia bacterium]|nr:YihY family inner membrane protein [Elusimicrobiota bacterium]
EISAGAGGGFVSARLERLERWWRPGLLCIGDAAHAMVPPEAAALDLAIRDAVAASNILAEPARSGRLSPRHLRRVQRRRRWPARVVQRAQRIARRSFAARAPVGDASPEVPASIRLLARHPALRRAAGRLIGWSPRPELPLLEPSRRRPRPSLSATWRLGGLSPVELSRRVWRQVGRDDLYDRAASLSFYFMFSLFPMLIVLTAVFGLLSAQGLMEDLLVYADRVLPSDAASLLRKTFQEISAGAGGGFVSAGLAGSLWVASSGMVSTISALNRAFGIREPRSWLRRRLTAIGLTVGFSLLALVALFLIAFGGPFGERVASFAGLGELFKSVWSVFRWTAGPLAALAGVGLVYRLAPAGRRGRPLPTPGAVFAVVAWIAASQGLSVYVGASARYNAVYGSIGAVVVLLLWLYLSALTLLVGAEIDAEIERAASQ